MDSNTPKTISFRADEVTAQKMDNLKKIAFEGRAVSNTLILRTAVDFFHDNYGKGLTDTEDTFEIVKAYVKVAFLNKSRVDFNALDMFLSEIEQVYEEYYQEETIEIAKLYDDENPITVAQLIRFKDRKLPEIFLRIMEVDENYYAELSDDELAEFLLFKLTESDFKAKASKLFNLI